MNNETVILHFKGFFNYKIINQLLADFVNYANESKLNNYFFKKIQIVMVEMLENNYQYFQGSLTEKILKSTPEFKLIKSHDSYKLLASNPILVDDADNLKTQIDKINNSNYFELKRLYKEILKDGMYSKKKTAGIGLIRIAKVTKNKIGYSFRKIDNKLLNYTLEIMVNPK